MIDDDDIKVVLKDFETISLSELNGDSFMDRIEIKYLFPVNKIGELIRLMKDNYKLLEIKQTRALPYITTYMDTTDYFFYNQHIRGEFARHKIRHRRYEINGDSFLEIKMKTNKGRTLKWRVENDFQPGVYNNDAEELIDMHLTVESSLLTPSLTTRFKRITAVGKETEERLTIDYNIDFTDPLTGSYIEMPYLGVIEMKKTGFSHRSPFNSLAKSLYIYPEGFSKYCTGNAILKPRLKTNMLKPKILLLKSIENEYIQSCRN
jgi:hypothetical protein